MQQFRFIGALTMYGATRLNMLGQPFEAPLEDVAVEGGVPALPVETFDEIFTAEDCKQFGPYNSRISAPAEFEEKMRRAAIALAELRGA